MKKIEAPKSVAASHDKPASMRVKSGAKAGGGVIGHVDGGIIVHVDGGVVQH